MPDTEPERHPGGEPERPERLHPEEVSLQTVDPRAFRPNERGDAWLYWLTDRDGAARALRQGLPIDPAEPLLLIDRAAVLPRLASMAEEAELAPNAVAVLRLRRIAAAPFLEPAPAPNCYLLSGAGPGGSPAGSPNVSA